MTTVDLSADRPEARATASGVRSGALLLVASAVSIVANYVFLLATGRILGSDAYGSFAALLGLLAVVLIPATGLQMAVSREVSRRLAAGQVAEAAAFSRATLRFSARATLPLLVVGLALAVPIDRVLHIHSVGVVVLAELTLITAFVFPAAQGVLQGAQRFGALSMLYVVPFVLRLVALGIAAALGYRLGGAVFATVVGSMTGVAIALAYVRETVRSPSAAAPSLRPFLRYLGPVVIGLVGIALLTHVDILVVKARFSAHEAGAYGAASAFARVGFFLPATILAVLFPRTAARQARGEETEDILGRSLLATAVFCAGLALFYAATGVGLVATTFGVDFADGGRVLAPYALAIGLFSLANILVGYHLSRGETRYAWIVAGGVLVQVAILATVPSGLHGVVWCNLAVGAVLLAVHEVAVESSVPALRAGLAHGLGTWQRVAAVVPEAVTVLLVATAFVCVLFWPVVHHLGSTIVGVYGGDATGSVAWFWQARHESGFHLLGATHHTLTGAPFGWSETNALQLQVLWPYYPTYLLAHVVGDVAAWNVTMLAGYVLAGATMYWLVRYLGCSRLVAAWAGLVCIIFPWHLARAEHVSLLHVEVLALLLLALVAASRRPSWLRFALVGAANFACWLTSGYFGAIAMVTTVAFGVGAALVSGRRRGLLLVAGTAAWSFAVILLLGVAAVASGTNAGAGLRRISGDLWFYGVRPVQLVVPSMQNIVLGGSLGSFWRHHPGTGANLTETTNYLGLLTIALAVGWIVVALRRRDELSRERRTATAGLAVAFVVGLAFALPSPSHVFGASIPMPARLLWEAVPAFRVPARWDPLLVTALVPLAAFGLQALVRRSRHAAVGVAIVAAAMVFSFLELTIHPAQARFRTTMPPEYAAVERQPPGALAEYPLGHSDVFHFWQTKHGRPIVNNAPADTTADSARLMLLDPAQPGTARSLALLGVSVVALHPGAHVDSEVPAHTPGTGFALVGRFPDGASVWRVTAPPAPAFAMLPGGFGTPEYVDGTVRYPLTSTAGVGVVQLVSKRAETVELRFDAFPPGGTTRTLRVGDSMHDVTFQLSVPSPVSVVVAVPRGRSQLLVKVDPAATSADDAVAVTAPQAQRTSKAPALHADLVAADPGF
ncbi:MAG: lipopolysaccharide biosynthesis protein [Gaiellaceae bacterium]